MDPELWELLEEGDSDDEVAGIIRLGRPGRLPSDIRFIAQLGEIVTVRIKRGSILNIRQAAEVASFKAPGAPLGPDVEMDDTELIEGLAESVQLTDERRPSSLDATGRGVVVGIVDWGFDFAHPDFRNPDGSTRLLALWDQRGKPRPESPQPYGYGIVHTREALNAALAADDPYAALDYHPADADTGRGAHGTHVASIAAGNGGGGGPVGIAPQAELVCVHLTTWEQEQSTSAKLGNSVTLLEAVDFIVRTAGERPWAINLSMGRTGEQHDGTTLVEQGLDAVLRAAPGGFIGQSTGNYYNRMLHASGQLRPTEERSFVWEIHEADQTPNEMEIWYPGRDKMEIEVRSPDRKFSAHASLGEQVSLTRNEQGFGKVYHRAAEPNNLDNHIDIFLHPGAPTGQWEVVLRASDVVDGRYHAWIERDAACPRCQTHFLHEDANPSSTTGTICNGLRTMAVGAYNPHHADEPIASFSSVGPTRDGRLKPDLCAPGVGILAARSATRHADAPSPRLTRMSGTSMAAPHVTGTVALMFEVAPRRLRIEETRNLLLASTRRVYFPEEVPGRTGGGYLDIERAVEAARSIGLVGPELTPASVVEMEDTMREDQETEASEQVREDEGRDSVPEAMERAETMDNPEYDSEMDAWETPEDGSARDVHAPAINVDDWFEAEISEWETPDNTPAGEFESLVGSYDLLVEGSDADERCDSGTFEETDNQLVEIADRVVCERRGGCSPRLLLHEVLSRTGVTDSLSTVDPARIFDAFAYARDRTLLAHLEAIFESIALPLSRLTEPLMEGDILVRRGDGGFAHIAFIAQPEILPWQRLSELGRTPETRLPGTYAQVVDGGAQPHGLRANFARRITEPGNRLPYDQLILRVRAQDTASEVWELAEPVNRRSPEYARWIQSSLNQLIQAGLQVDGIIGPLTRAATRAFQQQHPPLIVDGIVGPRTEAAMITAGAPPPPGADAPVIPLPITPPIVPALVTSLNPTRWGPILQPRISPSAVLRTGNAVKFLIDGPDTFRDFVHAIRSANSSQHYIYLLGWSLVDDFELIPCDPTTTPRALLTAAAGRGVQIRAMLWATHPGNILPARNIDGLPTGASILDGRFPGAFGAHHQKVLVVKGEEGLIGFCGGLDMNSDRINACPLSRNPIGPPNPQHDVHCRVVGPAAFDLLDTFIRRWRHHPDHTSIDSSSKGALLGYVEPVPSPVSPSSATTSTGRTSSVVIARTFNPVTPGSTLPRERDIRTLLIEAIRNSERFIYMEDQYLISLEAARELRAAIPRLQHLTILTSASEILAGSGSIGTGGLPCVWTLRQDFIRTLSAGLSLSDRAKIGIFVLTTPPVRTPPLFGAHTYVHAKTWVLDDELAVIGSANCNRRGWTHDSEVNAFIFDEGVTASMPVTAAPNFAQAIRMQLWAEHLNVSPAAVTDGVISASLWRRPPPGARIRPYNPTAGSDARLLNCGSPTTRNVIDPEIA
jgi:phosphatidylserine/phosphatidylglycerophosphate/cardiolipin synthase-like enzyme